MNLIVANKLKLLLELAICLVHLYPEWRRLSNVCSTNLYHTERHFARNKFVCENVFPRSPGSNLMLPVFNSFALEVNNNRISTVKRRIRVRTYIVAVITAKDFWSKSTMSSWHPNTPTTLHLISFNFSKFIVLQSSFTTSPLIVFFERRSMTCWRSLGSRNVLATARVKKLWWKAVRS